MKQINKLVIVFGIVVILLSCRSTSDITGIYLMQNNPHKFVLSSDSTFGYNYIDRGTIDIHSSGTWKRIGDNTVIIDSRIKNNIVPMHIEKKKSDKPTIQVCVNTLITKTAWKEYTDKDYCITPYINGKNYLDTHPELSDEPLVFDIREMLGMDVSEKSDEYLVNAPPVKRGNYCLCIDETIDSIYFMIKKRPKFFEWIGGAANHPYYILETEHKHTGSKAGEIINVTVNLNDSLFSYKVFNNTELKIRGNKLIFKDSEEKNKKNKLKKKK
jgi:hypothetical protein